MIYNFTQQGPPQNFNPRFEFAGCMLGHDGKILLLHRHDNKSQGSRWGLPGGKLDGHETPIQAMQRELAEETGLDIAPGQLTYHTKYFVHHAGYDFIWHVFSCDLSNKPVITIHPYEHQNFIWLTPTEALSYPLVDDLPESLKNFYNLS